MTITLCQVGNTGRVVVPAEAIEAWLEHNMEAKRPVMARLAAALKQKAQTRVRAREASETTSDDDPSLRGRVDEEGEDGSWGRLEAEVGDQGQHEAGEGTGGVLRGSRFSDERGALGGVGAVGGLVTSLGSEIGVDYDGDDGVLTGEALLFEDSGDRDRGENQKDKEEDDEEEGPLGEEIESNRTDIGRTSANGPGGFIAPSPRRTRSIGGISAAVAGGGGYGVAAGAGGSGGGSSSAASRLVLPPEIARGMRAATTSPRSGGPRKRVVVAEEDVTPEDRGGGAIRPPAAFRRAV